MSRVGKKSIQLDQTVECEILDENLIVKGQLGELRVRLSRAVKLEMDENQIRLTLHSITKQSLSNWGTQQRLIVAAIQGVAKGFQRSIEMRGVGYRAAVQGINLVMNLGFSHDVVYPIPAGIQIICEKPTLIIIRGINKQAVGQVAADIRSFSPPEPYNNTGLFVDNEEIERKEGKK